MPIDDLRINLTSKLNKIEVNARRDVLSQTLQGEWSTVFKGRGIEFAGFRDYQYGDDASLIDWRASLRSKQTLIREFEEYKNFTILFLFDISDSMLFSSHETLKCEYAAEIIYVLADAMNKAGDSIGMAMFNSEVINKIYPYIGAEALANIKANLLNKNNYGGGFNLKRALLTAKNFLGSNAVIIVVSDFFGMDEGWEKYIHMLSPDFEVIGLCIRDPRDRVLPKNVGQLLLKDPFSGEKIYIDTGKFSKKYNVFVERQEEYMKYVFRRSKGDFLLLSTDNREFTKDLINFFKKRANKTE